MYLVAGRPIPGRGYYDDGALYENGVGAVRAFVDAFDEGLAGVPRMDGRRIRLVTGASMAPFLRERAARLEAAASAPIEVVEVANAYFGETVTVAGLLGGEDILSTLGDGRPGDLVLLPAEALNADERFIDDVPLAALEERLPGVEFRPAHEVTEALGRR
jgi:NifB/MoaA-like Fe-S oxidoreductase